MYEQFTDRARKVMALANQESQRFNHEYLGTEHLLLGLVKEGSGVAAHVLKNFDVDLTKLRKAVVAIVGEGPVMLTMGKLPLTPRAKEALAFATEERKQLGHNYVGTEHLLLALLRQSDGSAVKALQRLRVKRSIVREEVLQLLTGAEPAKKPSLVLKDPPPAVGRVPMLHVEFTIPAGADRDLVDKEIAKIFVALSDLHRAHGGSGLRIVDGHAYEGVPANASESPKSKNGTRERAGVC